MEVVWVSMLMLMKCLVIVIGKLFCRCLRYLCRDMGMLGLGLIMGVVVVGD